MNTIKLHPIAIIDDEPQITDAVERLLKDRFQVFKFNDPAQFIEHIKHNLDIKFSVIISDQKMPKLTGTELLSHSIIYQPNATRILLTGYSELESVISAINDGHVYRYLHKPWEPNDLISTVTEGAQKYQLILDNQAKAEALELANAELKNLDQAKNQFMVLINHELKTPITGILSYLELLKETSLNEDQRKYVTQIESNSHRLYKMIQDSLLIVSSESKLLKPEIQKFDPSKMLDFKLGTDFESWISKKNLQLKIDLGNKNWIGDPKLISQVIRRLLENAVRFAKPKTTITLASLESASHRVTIKIHNFGPPVPIETLQNLGKPFYIAEDILKHSKGTGLGLSVVESLLKLHNSKLEIQNTDDGVEARFILPSLGK
jgi:signal transduction histidine kinase